MQTTIPLTRLTLLRPADLLPLLGSPDAQVLAVATRDVPANAMRLAPLLRLRSPAGQDYLHVILGVQGQRVVWLIARVSGIDERYCWKSRSLHVH